MVEFQAATAAFLASLLEQGPGRHAADLPAGLEALRRFQKQAEAMAKQREQLALAEHLFDLEQTFYQDLSKVRAGGVRPLFCVYPQKLNFCFSSPSPDLTPLCICTMHAETCVSCLRPQFVFAGRKRAQTPSKRVRHICLTHGLAAHFLSLPLD